MKDQRIYCHWCLKNQPAKMVYSEPRRGRVKVCRVCGNAAVTAPKTAKKANIT